MWRSEVLEKESQRDHSFFFFNKFIYFWLHWVFAAACGLSLVVASGDYVVHGLLIAAAFLVAEHRL